MPQPEMKELTDSLTSLAVRGVFKTGVIVILVIIAKVWFERFLRELSVKLKRKKEAEKIGKSREVKIEFDFKKRRPVSEHEEKLMRLLNEIAKPLKLQVFPQVAFSAFISTRNEFNRISQKRADFLICSMEMEPLAVVELDDWSHKGREVEDAERDAIIQSADIEVIRYARLPERTLVMKDLMRIRKQAITPA